MNTNNQGPLNSLERMSDFSFRAMVFVMKIEDFFWRRIDARVQTFGIRPGMTVVDYGCGPGRYTIRFARLVGEAGRVYAVDVHQLAVREVQKKAQQQGLRNVTAVLAGGYDSTLPAGIADVVCCLDMFFGVREPTTLLTELKRIAKPDGVLIIDDGHQPRSATLGKIRSSGQWAIAAETRDHLTCKPIS